MRKRGRRNIISKNISKINDAYKSTNKSTSGITLIALVVTIIILIILASISISILLGENGLLEKAKQGKSDYINARDAELAQMDNASDEIEALTKPDPTPGELEQIGEDTYEINSIEDLVALAYSVNTKEEKYNGKTIELGRSLDFTKDTSYVNPQAKYRLDTKETGYVKDEENGISLKAQLLGENGFVPIGTGLGTDTAFYGIFNGNNNVISNINIKLPQTFAGLIGTVKNKERLDVNDLGLEGGRVEGEMFVGGIVGRTNSGEIHITNCHNTADVTATFARAGGILGNLDGTGTITNCYNTGTIKSVNFAGGILGNSNGKMTITNCYNMGAITNLESSSTKQMGGIVGNKQGDTLTILNCYNAGDVITEDKTGQYIGGIIGTSYSGEVTNISNCYNTGRITAELTEEEQYSSGSAGGIIGETRSNTDIIANCYNTGLVTLTKFYYAGKGGIVGRNRGATPTNTYYLSGTAEKGIGIVEGDADVQTGTTVKTLAQMKSPNFLTEIKGTTGATAWKQTNGEIPVLSWQK